MCVEPGFPPRNIAPKSGLDETVELLICVLDASEEDSDMFVLCAALTTKLARAHLKNPRPTMSC